MNRRPLFLRPFAGALAITLLVLGAATADVVRPAPDFRWLDARGKSQSVKEFRGQPVVLLITPSVENRSFRSQLRELARARERLAANRTVFITAFTGEPGRIPSNIPFVIAGDGPAVGSAFEATDGFAIAFIGMDGNLDYITNEVLSDQRTLDVISNSFAFQKQLRVE